MPDAGDFPRAKQEHQTDSTETCNRSRRIWLVQRHPKPAQLP